MSLCSQKINDDDVVFFDPFQCDRLPNRTEAKQMLCVSMSSIVSLVGINNHPVDVHCLYLDVWISSWNFEMKLAQIGWKQCERKEKTLRITQ